MRLTFDLGPTRARDKGSACFVSSPGLVFVSKALLHLDHLCPYRLIGLYSTHGRTRPLLNGAPETKCRIGMGRADGVVDVAVFGFATMHPSHKELCYCAPSSADPTRSGKPSNAPRLPVGRRGERHSLFLNRHSLSMILSGCRDTLLGASRWSDAMDQRRGEKCIHGLLRHPYLIA